MTLPEAPADSAALFALARQRLFALDGSRDLKAAHDLLRKAAGKGHVEAARTRAYLIANGMGCRADPEEGRRLLAKIAPRDAEAAAQIDLLKRLGKAPAVRREPVNGSPEIVLIGGLLAPEECRHLIARAEPTLQPSFVVDPASGQRIPHPVRTSHGTSFGPTEEDLVINRINRRIAAASGTRYEQGEPLHMLRYAPGQEYRPHVDALPGVANQRLWTMLVYLNDGYRGGETDFPELGITIGGAMGDALLFRNLDDDGRPDPLTRHAGLPVTSGTKWLATRWIRQAAYHPWDEDVQSGG